MTASDAGGNSGVNELDAVPKRKMDLEGAQQALDAIAAKRLQDTSGFSSRPKAWDRSRPGGADTIGRDMYLYTGYRQDTTNFRATRQIYSRQIPSALSLKRAPTATLRNTVHTVAEAGYAYRQRPIQSPDIPPKLVEVEDRRYLPIRDEGVTNSKGSSALSRNSDGSLRERLETHILRPTPTQAYPAEDEDSDDSFASTIDGHEEFFYYGDDFFRTMRGYYQRADQASWAYQEGREKEAFPLPEIRFASGDDYRLSDPLPMRHLRKVGYTGKNSLTFVDFREPSMMMDYLMKFTHWGSYIDELLRERSTNFSFAVALKKRIKFLLEGRHDPEWRSDLRVALYGKEYQKRSSKSRASRFLQMLRTVDGIFVQDFLANPEICWNWKRYDQFLLSTIWALIGDEFLDGNIEGELSLLKTQYARLKSMRKAFKARAHSYQRNQPIDDELVPAWLRYRLEGLNEAIRGSHCKDIDMQRVQILTQSRGCGTPPLIMHGQSQRKMLLTVSEPPSKMPRIKRMLLERAVRDMVEKIRPEHLTGMDTVATVKITANAAFHRAQKEGGGIAAVQEMIIQARNGVPVRRIDLYTGQLLDEIPFQKENAGEYIFYACLRACLEEEDLQSLTIGEILDVSEPSKVRVVNKSKQHLKIVQDVFSKMLSKMMLKAYPSAAAGLGKANQGWQFFRSLFRDEESREILFQDAVEPVKIYRSENQFEVTHVWKEVYLGMTDFECATDAELHEVARIIMKPLLIKAGFPPLIIGLLLETTLASRILLFKPKGAVKDLGEVYPKEPEFNFIRTHRGIFMGDPTAKPILTMTNEVIRYLERQILNQDWLKEIFPNLDVERSIRLFKSKLEELGRVFSG